MPVNYLEVENNLTTFTQKLKARTVEMEKVEAELWAQFSEPNFDIAEAIEKIARAESLRRSLYCAKPTDESLLMVHSAPTPPERYTLSAADGSQIAPNRHRPFPFGIINVGLIKARHGTGAEPEIEIRSKLLDFDLIYANDGTLIREDEVALERDVEERQALLDFCMSDELPALTLTDGPLSIFQGARPEEQQKEIQDKSNAINRVMEHRHIISAGYIDKPGSDMISRMLSLLNCPDDQLARYDESQRRWRGVSDARLLLHLLIRPGERSAVFEAVTKNNQTSNPLTAIHFFYLNIGQEEPYLVRVEFPAWVSHTPGMVDILHAVVYAETRVLDTHPYPYLLHRAHELAVVSLAEHEQVEEMLRQELSKEGLPVGMISNKEANKELNKRR